MKTKPYVLALATITAIIQLAGHPSASHTRIFLQRNCSRTYIRLSRAASNAPPARPGQGNNSWQHGRRWR